MVNKIGNDRNNKMRGTSRDDILRGLGGRDYLSGYGGDDILCGDDGNDALKGGRGDDTLKGGKNNDKLYGYNGMDILYGDEGNDRIYGGRDNDKLYGGLGNDYLDGDSGNDKLYGELGNDNLYGDRGKDILYGDQGFDTLRGDTGADTLYGGAGNDYLDGGDGNDVLYGENLNDSPGPGDDDVEELLFISDFEDPNNLYEGWHIHANPQSAVVVNAPADKGGNAVKMSMNRTDDFSGIINGKPRAELARVPDDYLYAGVNYQIKYKTYIPSNFKFDQYGNRESLMQIHQSNGLGTSPLFILGLDGDRYFNFVEPPFQSQEFDFWGSARNDRGKWVDWSLNYKASTGDDGLYELYKNNELVSSFEGPNSYHNDGAYIKIGVYKWFWTNHDVYNRAVYYDDVSIVASGSSNNNNDTYFFEKGDDTDTIIDVRGKNDTVKFGSGLSADDAILNQLGNDLEITFENSSNDKLIIKDYWSFGIIENFEFQDGYSLTFDDINNIIAEMAQLEPVGDYSIGDEHQEVQNTNLVASLL